MKLLIYVLLQVFQNTENLCAFSLRDLRIQSLQFVPIELLLLLSFEFEQYLGLVLLVPEHEALLLPLYIQVVILAGEHYFELGLLLFIPRRNLLQDKVDDAQAHEVQLAFEFRVLALEYLGVGTGFVAKGHYVSCPCSVEVGLKLEVKFKLFAQGHQGTQLLLNQVNEAEPSDEEGYFLFFGQVKLQIEGKVFL